MEVWLFVRILKDKLYYMNYLEKLAKVVSRKRKQDVSKISKITGYSAAHVSNTLAGRRINKSIVEVAYNIGQTRVANDTVIATTIKA